MGWRADPLFLDLHGSDNVYRTKFKDSQSTSHTGPSHFGLSYHWDSRRLKSFLLVVRLELTRTQSFQLLLPLGLTMTQSFQLLVPLRLPRTQSFQHLVHVRVPRTETGMLMTLAFCLCYTGDISIARRSSM